MSTSLRTRPSLVAALALLVAAAASAGCDNPYQDVVSIKTTHEFQDPALLARAWALPVAAAYARVGLSYQKNGGFCGPATAVNLAHSLGDRAVDQGNVLEGTGQSWFTMISHRGMNLDTVAQVIRDKTGKKVTVLRDLTRDEFRRQMKRANSPDRRYTINFHRGPLFGKGGGHHSPIGGYLESEDLVFVLDVNEKFHPWLVKTDRLYDAIDTIDHDGNRKRGLLLIQ
jgi:hypothetical protein